MPRLSSVVSYKLPFAPVYKKYMQKNKIKSWDTTQKIPTDVGLYFGAPGAIRTRSPRLRRAMLYPVEPRVQGLHIIIICIKNAIYFIVCSRCKHAIIKSSKSPSKTASESVFSTPVRTSLTNWYGYKT